MALDTNFNASPYYDDYDENNKFLRLLFKPGFAVQSRELTQLQTVLQDQVRRFGEHAFKNGSFVSGGGPHPQNATYLKLESTYSGVDVIANNFIGQTIVDNVTSPTKRAEVLKVIEATGNDPITLMVTQNFGEPFSSSNTIFTSDGLHSANTTANGVGIGQVYSRAEGVYFYDGFFIKSDPQTVVVSKYSTNQANVRIGFEVTESIVTSTGDTNLLDPAVEASNFQAPGSDRYKIELILTTRELTSTDDSKFIELARVENGVYLDDARYPIYSVLAEELARRTYDESGNYTVKNFNISLETNASNTAQTDVILSPGKAYVYGYEIKNDAPIRITYDKPRTTESVTNKIISTDYGSYLFTKNHYGTFPINSLINLDLHCVPISSINVTTTATISNTKIGTARVRSISFDNASNTSNSQTYTYKTFLFDVNVNQAITGNVVSATSNTVTISDAGAGNYFTTVVDAYKGAKLRITTGNGSDENPKYITSFNPVTQVATLDESFINIPNSSSIFSIDFEVNDIESIATLSGTSFVNYADVDDKSKDFSTIYQDVFIADTRREPLIFPLGQSYVANGTISVGAFSYRRLYSSQGFSSNTTTLTVGTGESLASGSSSASVLQNYMIVVTSQGTSPYQVGEIIPSDKITVNSTSRQITVANSLTMTANIISTIDVSNLAQKNKTFVQANSRVQVVGTPGQIQVFSGNTAAYIYPGQGQTTIASTFVVKVPNEKQSLFVSDVDELISVFDFANNPIANTGYTDVTDRYTLDNGQRDSFYDHASISLKPGATPPVGPIVVRYNKFDSTDTGGFFTADSYVNYEYDKIKSFESVKFNNIYELRDCVDFRPVRADASFGSGDTVSFKVGSSASGPKIPENASNLVANYNFYLPRIDKVIVYKNKTFDVVKGIPSTSPVEPAEQDNGMTLYVLRTPAYIKNTSEINVIYKDNRRYTMRDIGLLDKRIERLEYYTALSLLEQDAINKQDLTIRDTENLPRFKNGILVDSFDGHSIADVTDISYQASIDTIRKEMRPSFNISSHSLTFDAANSSNFVRTGPFIMATSSELLAIEQNKASRAINVNPFNVINFLGNIELDPKSDIWVDTETKPDVLVDLTGDREAWALLSNATTYEWGSWQTTWSGVISSRTFDVQNNKTDNWQQLNAGVGGKNDIVRHTVQTTQTNQTRTGVATTFSPQTITNSIGDRIVDVSIIPYMRQTNILFVGTAFKPNTTVYPFFDNISVEKYVGNRVNKFYVNTNNIGFKRTISDPETIQIRNAATNALLGTAIVAHVSNNIVYVTNVVATASFDVANYKLVGQSTALEYTATDYEHNGGLCTGGGGNTITLALHAAGANNIASYNSAPIFIVQGPGAGQSATISSYNPATRVATISGTWTTTPVSGQTIYSIGRPRTDESGSVVGIFTVPAGTFRTGEKLFRLTEAQSGDLPSSTTSGDARFFAQGLLQKSEEVLISTTQLNITRTSASESRISTDTRTTSRQVVWTDPLAETFLVSPAQYSQGFFMSKVRVCFKTKDNVVPITLQVRPVVNGFPSSSEIYPFGSVTLTPDKVKVSDAPNFDDPNTYTDFVFDVPLFIQPGEHCFVLLANSNKYEVYIAEIGKLDVVSGRQISEQPYGGSLFLSQNGSTWTPEQTADMMFRVYRYTFNTNPINLQFLVNTPSSNVVYDVIHPIIADVSTANTYINYQFNSERISGGFAGYKPIRVATDYEMTDGAGRRVLNSSRGNTTFIVKATMGTSNPDITPMIDATRFGVLAIENRINNLGLSNADISIANSGSGYANSSDVTVTISGGNGSGATAVANVVSGRVDAVYIVNPGSGYTESPTITLTPGSGGGSGALAIVNGEDGKRGGNSVVRYISKRVTLADGFESGDLRVYLTAYRPANSNINVYYKLLSDADTNTIDDNSWSLMTQIGENTNYLSVNANDYREFTFAPGKNNTPNNNVVYTTDSAAFNTFKTFVIKIVLSSSEPTDVPRVRDFRAIAMPAGA